LQEDVFRACLPYEYVLYISKQGENLLKGWISLKIMFSITHNA
jgi:hypothetical protein